MKLPGIINELIRLDPALASSTYSAIDKMEKWIAKTPMAFFPEYTDHDPKHNEDVLHTAIDLMADSAKGLLTPSDAMVLTLSTLLHDCAMHLTEDGFISLVRPDSRLQPLPGFRERPWSTEWQSFLSEASRFDGRKLVSLFGDSEPPRRPPLNPIDMTERDRMLIGEFVRRHHTRLAHEIACYGVPGVEGRIHKVLDNTETKLADAAGLVARSHGLSVRACLDYLEEQFHLRDYNGLHAVFLMALLRIADYLQIQPQRAPTETLSVRRLRSPVSATEWKVHESIRNITGAGLDPEAIHIDARPKDVATYLRLKSWLDGLQFELDSSWAVLGEVYGRYGAEDLNKFGLRIRRVKSNLDNEDDFAKRVPYVPAKVQFEAASTDLLKLLIRPLYGDRPEIGVRELMQNAVDAVRELNTLVASGAVERPMDDSSKDVDVEIGLEWTEGLPAYLYVTDTGIGMTAEVVQRYFLRAGASFRGSDDWRRMFQDQESNVLRSGRFGVGVLAAFLIGDEVHVSTRHVSAAPDKGLEFTASLDAESVELKRIGRSVGTTIRIRIGEDSQDAIGSWAYRPICDWFCLSYPKVVRMFSKDGGVAKQEHVLPKPCDEDTGVWRSLVHPDYDGILWAFEEPPGLACNGIIISRSAARSRRLKRRSRSASRESYNFIDPNISVFDSKGRFPLNLQRTGLTADVLPFSEELWGSIYDDFLAFCLVNAPNSRGEAADPESMAVCGGYRGLLPGSTNHDVLFSCFDGVGLMERSILGASNVRSIVVAPRTFPYRRVTREAKGGLTLPVPRSGQAVIGVYFSPGRAKAALDHLRYTLGRSYDFGEICGRRILVHKKTAGWLTSWEHAPKYVTKLFKENVEASDTDWILLKVGTCPGKPSKEFFSTGEKTLSYIERVSPIIAEWYLPDTSLEVEETDFAREWRRRLGGVVIPFDKKKRKQRFKKVYGGIAQYIRIHESLRAQAEKSGSDIA